MNIRHPQTISVLKITGIKSRQKSAMWPASHLAESPTMETKTISSNFGKCLPVIMGLGSVPILLLFWIDFMSSHFLD